MYKFLLAAALFISPACFSQDSSNHVQAQDSPATMRVLNDTQRFLDSMKAANENNNAMQGLNNLLQYQKEQNAKRRRQAYLYIGLGIFFLIVLIVGFMRRSRPASPK